MYEIPRNRRRKRLIKILVLAAVFSILGIFAVRFLKLEHIFFRGPQTVIKLITESGLKSDNGRINILVLGTGGVGHEGPDLSDTMILASIDKKGTDVALVSIPRDLWAPSISAKINAAYAFGQEKNQNGLKLAKGTVASLFGLPIHYAVRVDFNGFVKTVNLVDGIDVNIDNSFTDTKYPIDGKENETCGVDFETKVKDGIEQTYFKDATGSATLLTEQNDPFTCRYETLSFKKGLVHMDGATALKYVRSRHGDNGEGSDFARSARQQKVILSTRDKVISANTLLDPKTIINLISTFSQSIDTDIRNDDVALFAKLGRKIDPTTVRKIVLDSDRPESLLVDGDPSSYGGQYVLVPKNGWQDLAEYIQGEVFKNQK